MNWPPQSPELVSISTHQYKHFSEKLTLNGDKCCDISQAYKKKLKTYAIIKAKVGPTRY